MHGNFPVVTTNSCKIGGDLCAFLIGFSDSLWKKKHFLQPKTWLFAVYSGLYYSTLGDYNLAMIRIPMNKSVSWKGIRVLLTLFT